MIAGHVTLTAPEVEKAPASDRTEEPMDLSRAAQNTDVPSVVEDVEADHSAAVKSEAITPKSPSMAVKQEPESPKSDKKSEDGDNKPASPAGKHGHGKIAAHSEAIESGIASGIESGLNVEEDDLEVDGVCIEPPRSVTAAVVSQIKPPLVDHRQKPVPAQRSVDKTSTEVDQLRQELETLKMAVEGEKTQNQKLLNTLSYMDQEICDTLMDYADTGNSDYFLAKFRNYLTFTDRDGNNPLHAAVLNNQVPTLRQLLHICYTTKSIRPIHQRNNRSKTPLLVAAYEKNHHMVDMLLSFRANPLDTDSNGNNCFHIACELGDVNTLTVLCKWLHVVQKKSIIDKTNIEGFSPLHLAVQGGHFECMKELLKSGANPDKGDGTSGRTALHHVVLNRSNSPHTLLMVTELVMVSADFNAQAMDGNTALHFAVDKKDAEIVRALVKYGADPEIENYQRNEREDNDDMIGNNAYDLCGDDGQLLDVLLASMAQRARLVVNHHSMTGLGADVRRRLAKELDSGDWKRLAKQLGHSNLIPPLEAKLSPTESLLSYLDFEREMSVRKLEEGLISIGRQDCTKLVKNITTQQASSQHTVTENPHALHSVLLQHNKSGTGTASVVDSGYVGSVGMTG